MTAPAEILSWVLFPLKKDLQPSISAVEYYLRAPGSYILEPSQPINSSFFTLITYLCNSANKCVGEQLSSPLFKNTALTQNTAATRRNSISFRVTAPTKHQRECQVVSTNFRNTQKVILLSEKDFAISHTPITKLFLFNMAANFWNSTHYRNWLRKVDDIYAQSQAMRQRDQSLFKDEEMVSIKATYSQIISTLAKNSKLRQRVAATAIVYFKRFFARNAIRDHDPRLIAPVALYLAAKAEEHTLPAKIVVAQMSNIYLADHAYPYTVEHVYDYEFKMIAALEFDLIIYHPYRPMVQYCSDGGMADLLTSAWPILNDSYRTDACLRYPPYLIAIACIFIAGTLQERDMTEWLKKLNIDLQELGDITQYLSTLYVSPAPVRANGSHVERINNKLHSHFGPKIQNVTPSISKKPPSSSRPKMSSKAGD